MRTAKGGRGIRAEAWGFNLAETYPNQGLIIPVAWRERSKQRSVPQGSESYRGKEPTREMLLFGADRANNDGMRLWRCPRSRKPEGACPRWRVLDNREYGVDHRIDTANRIRNVRLVDRFSPSLAETVNRFRAAGSRHSRRTYLTTYLGPADHRTRAWDAPLPRGSRTRMPQVSRMHLGPCALANRRPSMP